MTTLRYLFVSLLFLHSCLSNQQLLIEHKIHPNLKEMSIPGVNQFLIQLPLHTFNNMAMMTFPRLFRDILVNTYMKFVY